MKKKSRNNRLYAQAIHDAAIPLFIQAIPWFIQAISWFIQTIPWFIQAYIQRLNL